MIIQQILNQKGRSVTTVRADTALQSVATLLDEQKIGAVVAIGEGDRVVGVLSERDIIRQLARIGAGALDMDVASAMTREVITANPQDSLDTCLSIMTDRRIRHLPVLEDGRLAGLISIGDLVKWKIAETQAEAESLKSYLAS